MVDELVAETPVTVAAPPAPLEPEVWMEPPVPPFACAVALIVLEPVSEVPAVPAPPTAAFARPPPPTPPVAVVDPVSVVALDEVTVSDEDPAPAEPAVPLEL